MESMRVGLKALLLGGLRGVGLKSTVVALFHTGPEGDITGMFPICTDEPQLLFPFQIWVHLFCMGPRRRATRLAPTLSRHHMASSWTWTFSSMWRRLKAATAFDGRL